MLKDFQVGEGLHGVTPTQSSNQESDRHKLLCL